MSLKLVQASSKNENTVVAQEINTAEFVCIELWLELNLNIE